VRCRVDHGDIQLVDSERGGHFRSDESTADDDGRFAFISLLSDFLVVVQGPEVADSVHFPAGNRKILRRSTGCQQQFLEPVALSFAIRGSRAFCIQRHNAPAREERQPVLIIKCLIVNKEILDFGFAEPQLLGQGRSVIWEMVFRPDHCYGAVAVLFPDPFNSRCPGQSCANNQVVTMVFRHIWALLCCLSSQTASDKKLFTKA
jgi:hypothetical protein